MLGSQVNALTADLHSRAKLPDHVEGMIRNFPKGMHPMTQLSSAVLALQTDSLFQKAYTEVSELMHLAYLLF